MLPSTPRLGVIAALLLQLTLVSAFMPQSARFPSTPTTSLFAAKSPEPSDHDDRRVFLSRLLSRSTASIALATILSTTTACPFPAHATYSAYTHREQDWERRQKAGDITVSNARALKQQLREIAPMNSERSKVFCPNGTPSSVSPLMENKCNDRETMPSVYGRSEDVVGNSIPGFSAAPAASYKYAAASSSATASLESLGGGFPDYGKVSATGSSLR